MSLFKGILLTCFIILITINLVKTTPINSENSPPAAAPSSEGFPGFLTSLINTLQRLKAQSQPVFEEWRKKSFHDAETPEISEQRNKLWNQLAETRLG